MIINTNYPKNKHKKTFKKKHKWFLSATELECAAKYKTEFPARPEEKWKCSKCHIDLILLDKKGSPARKITKNYVFAWYWWCPRCKRMILDERGLMNAESFYMLKFGVKPERKVSTLLPGQSYAWKGKKKLLVTKTFSRLYS